jgi:hypothetical protein
MHQIVLTYLDGMLRICKLANEVNMIHVYDGYNDAILELFFI